MLQKGKAPLKSNKKRRAGTNNYILLCVLFWSGLRCELTKSAECEKSESSVSRRSFSTHEQTDSNPGGWTPLINPQNTTKKKNTRNSSGAFWSVITLVNALSCALTIVFCKTKERIYSFGAVNTRRACFALCEAAP